MDALAVAHFFFGSPFFAKQEGNKSCIFALQKNMV